MGAPDATWVKRVDGGPDGYAGWEAAGLRWLGEATAGGGADVVEVREVRADGLVLERLTATAPTPGAAESFGRALATTQRAGATAWGAAPPGWDGEGWFGPADSPLPLEVGAWSSWGEMYAVRLASLTRLARDGGELEAEEAHAVDRLGERCAAGEFDTGDRVRTAYEEVAPFADGWRDRVALHQLHPLLVHALLFGGGYRQQVMAAVRAT